MLFESNLCGYAVIRYARKYIVTLAISMRCKSDVNVVDVLCL